MAISLGIYSNGNASSKTVTADFIADFLASSSNGVSNQTRYFFKFNTNAKHSDNTAIGVKVVEGLDDLALNHEKQSAQNTANNYSDIRSMVVDYMYDLIHGHTEGQYLTSVRAQLPMKFSR